MEKLSKEMFEKEVCRLKNIRSEVIKKIGSANYNEKTIQHFFSLIRKYGNSFCLGTLSYHIAIISTPDFDRTERLDFPGEDSLGNFLSNLLE